MILQSESYDITKPADAEGHRLAVCRLRQGGVSLCAVFVYASFFLGMLKRTFSLSSRFSWKSFGSGFSKGSS